MQPNESAAGPRRLHFRLRSIFVLTALVAVALAVAMPAGSRSLAAATLLLVAWTLLLSLPVGTFVAWLAARTDLPGRRAVLVLLGVMLFVPLYLQAAAWQAGFGVLGWQSLVFQGEPLLQGWRGAVWVHGMAAVPWVVLIAAVGFRLVEPELEEQALLDAPARRVVLYVTLPAALPAVVAAGLWVAVLTAGEMTVTDLFAVRTYAEAVYTRLALGDPPGEAVRGMLPGMGLTTGLLVLLLAAAGRLGWADRPLSLRRTWTFRLGRWRWPAGAGVWTGMLLVIGVPLGNLAYKAGVLVTQTDVGRERTWSAVKCVAIVASSPIRYARELGWTLVIAGLAATAAVVAGIVLAWAARRGGFRAGTVLVVTAMLLALPGPVVGLSVIWLLNRPELPPLVRLYDESILAPWLALVVRCLPAATLVLWYALRGVPREVLDAAAVDGAGPIGRLVRIALPSRWPGVGVAWLVALAVALGDLAASILVVPPGVTTLSIRIFGLLHYGVEDQVAGICLALVALFAAVAAAAVYLLRRWGSQQSAVV